MKIEEIKNKNFKISNPHFKENILNALTGQHFMNLTGFKITKIEAGYIEGELDIEQKHKQQYDFLHGGVSATCLDIVMGFASYTLLPIDKGVVTAQLDILYYNPGVGTKLIAKGWVDKAGSRLYFCEGEIIVVDKNENEILTNKAKAIMCVIEKPV